MRLALLLPCLLMALPSFAADTRPLLVRIETMAGCQPCEPVKAALLKQGVTLHVVPTKHQHAVVYPTAHYMTNGGAWFEERNPAVIIKRIESGQVRYTGTGAKPLVEIRYYEPKK